MGGAGPLSGVRVLELSAMGPVPFVGMLMADLGAEVLRVDRPPHEGGLDIDPERELMFRGRSSICLDLGRPGAAEVVLRLVRDVDVVLEGYRPGVADRLGIGPEICRAVNERLVYAQATGWGQDGPLAARAGHDLTYTALTGALDAIGERGRKPVPALNLISDFGGGGMFLAVGVLAALLERERSGQGQVVDAAMVDGASYLLTSIFTMAARGQWVAERGANVIDGGAPFYDTYECADGRYVAVGALEPKFWRTLVEVAALPVDPATQWDKSTWPHLRAVLSDAFATRSREEWTRLLEHVDACVAPVLTVEEAPHHHHLAARNSHVTSAIGAAPAPAPRFSRSVPLPVAPPPRPGASTRSVLAAHGFTAEQIADLEDSGVVHQATGTGA